MTSEQEMPRKLTAILYADVDDYSRLTGEDEEGTHRRLSEYLDLISNAIETHPGRVRPDELDAKSVVSAARQVTQAVEVESGDPLTTNQQFRPAVSQGPNPITIDAVIVRGKSIKSTEINCKIENS